MTITLLIASAAVVDVTLDRPIHATLATVMAIVGADDWAREREGLPPSAAEMPGCWFWRVALVSWYGTLLAGIR